MPSVSIQQLSQPTPKAAESKVDGDAADADTPDDADTEEGGAE